MLPHIPPLLRSSQVQMLFNNESLPDHMTMKRLWLSHWFGKVRYSYRQLVPTVFVRATTRHLLWCSCAFAAVFSSCRTILYMTLFKKKIKQNKLSVSFFFSSLQAQPLVLHYTIKDKRSRQGLISQQLYIFCTIYILFYQCLCTYTYFPCFVFLRK